MSFRHVKLVYGHNNWVSKMNEIKLIRKFNCKQKINYQSHIMMILRVQLVYELVIIVMTCLANMSFHFHLSHVYTTEFWTSEYVASSNFGLAFASLLMVPYTVKIQAIKGMLVKDVHFTMLALHVTMCFLYSHLSLTIPYILFACLIGALSITISSFAANIVEQNKLHSEIMQIESEDRKTYKKTQPVHHDPHEHHQLTEVQFQEQI